MTENEVGAIAGCVIVIAIVCLAGFRLWLDHKETMAELNCKGEKS